MVIPESAGDEYGLVVKVLKFVAEYVGSYPKPLDAADGVLDQDSDSGFSGILFFNSLGKFPGSGLTLRHGHRMVRILLSVSFKAQVDSLSDSNRNISGRSVFFQNAKVMLPAFHGFA